MDKVLKKWVWLNMKNLELKKSIFVLTASIVLLTCTASGRDYEPAYEIYEEEDGLSPYASYEDGDIYIGNQTYIDSIKEEVDRKDILVVDKRANEDPDMCILNSHRVRDPYDRNTILEVLQRYEEENPTAWERTIESMRNEWDIHNLLYFVKYKEWRTGHVDLNNEDETKYNGEGLTKVLRNG